MSGRKLNADELKLHQAALAGNDKILTIKEAERLLPDAAARTAAINFLLGTGMFKVMTSSGGVNAFRAVMKKEMDVKKDMSGEETMVLSHIQASGNEGIWTKHLKAKTELHQTVIDRCLKALVQKQLVKSIKAVRHPTRKIYMLAHLEPSVELTGGPWYTDNELDTEFIKLLSTACLHYIRDRSFPNQRGKRSTRSQRLYAIGAAPSYPSAQQIQHFLDKSKITETELGVEHVEMLLRVLELDGEIEKIPAFSATVWDAPVDSDDNSTATTDSESSDDERTISEKRKRDASKSEEFPKKKRRRTGDSDESNSEEDRPKSKKQKKRKRKIRSRKDDVSEEDGSDAPKSKKRKRNSQQTDDSDSESESGSEDHERGRRKSRKKSKKWKGKSSKRADLSSVSDNSESQSEDEEEKYHSKSKFKSRSSKTGSSSKRPLVVKPRLSTSPDLNEVPAGGGFVYRATRQEKVALGWSQAPCGRCPVFDFCRDKGPTNPRECVYYDEWFTQGAGPQKTAVVKVEI
ncbi:RNA polymerase Rpc34 subunit-domain-containing protein [Phlebopus sp. FC_14]|nr:RNA polymerase Rpc34 subunit-domain-containing protein [Phlebopus sp. FC_14]